MTAKAKTRRRKPAPVRRGPVLFCIISVFSLVMILRNSQVAIAYMQTGLRLCAASVIPSLFPFMVISELLVASGFGEVFGRFWGAPLGRLFGVSRQASTALLLGALCGFPVGAKTAVSLYDSGVISRAELERLMTFCNIPSSGFLISAVGVSLYGSHRFGVFLFFTALLSSILMGLMGRLFSKPLTTAKEITESRPRLPSVGVTTFTHAIASATASVLSVCACVVFFTAIIGCLSHTLSALALSPALQALLFGVFEISSGVNASVSLGDPVISAVICGFAVGWSGISVHFQILSLGCDRGISFAPYILSKLCQGGLCAFAAWLYVKCFDPHLLAAMQSATTLRPASVRVPYALCVCLLFLICVTLCYGRKRMIRRK